MSKEETIDQNMLAIQLQLSRNLDTGSANVKKEQYQMKSNKKNTIMKQPPLLHLYQPITLRVIPHPIEATVLMLSMKILHLKKNLLSKTESMTMMMTMIMIMMNRNCNNSKIRITTTMRKSAASSEVQAWKATINGK